MARAAALIAVAALLAACSKEEPAAPGAGGPGAQPLPSIESIARGAGLYQEHCAQCHGPEAQGHPDWRNPQAVAAPPLNGTGNDWKRSKRELMTVIKNGAKRGGEPVMPAWGGRLSDQDVEDIVTWFQALWPMDVYDRWRKANAGPTPKG